MRQLFVQQTELSFLIIFLSYRGAPAPQRFGALNMTAALGPFIMRHPEVKDNMEQFIMQHVTAEFVSNEPYLRAIVRPYPGSPSTLLLTYLYLLGMRGPGYRH